MTALTPDAALTQIKGWQECPNADPSGRAESPKASASAASGLTILFIAVLCWLAAPAVVFGEVLLQNQMGGDPSPYLELHAQDPVNWQKWDERTMTRARTEGKLLFVSVGYFSCHWCHVMQRESYQNPEIAAQLNERYIPVKVDRELQPALDARLMAFAERTLGQGGWPLNVFVTPDGYPLYPVLYVPPEQLKQILTKLDAMWTGQRDQLERAARREPADTFPDASEAIDNAKVVALVERFLDMSAGAADPMQGGFGDQSKFPQTPQLDLLLTLYERGRWPEVREVLDLTLGNMADKGLRDHIGEGFFRYTVDPSWEIPHFEKMLYDNALLARIYLRAAQTLDNDAYRRISQGTLDFLIDRMQVPEGPMVAAFSALDDRDVEGGYYLWQTEELAALLEGEQLDLAEEIWGLKGHADFETGHLPRISATIDELASKTSKPVEVIESELRSARQRLLEARDLRTLPVDGKLLAGWNGLALVALTEGAEYFGESRYREAAEKVRDYLANSLWNGERLLRAVSSAGEMGTASLEDYAYVAMGLLHWARLTGRNFDYALAREVASAGWQRFYVRNGWRLEEHSLLADDALSEVVMDGPMPAPAAVLADVTVQLADHFNDPVLARRAIGALNRAHDEVGDNAFFYATHIAALMGAASRPISESQ
jgi:uncharacterized protein YyaL (SSP411 family)